MLSASIFLPPFPAQMITKLKYVPHTIWTKFLFVLSLCLPCPFKVRGMLPEQRANHVAPSKINVCEMSVIIAIKTILESTCGRAQVTVLYLKPVLAGKAGGLVLWIFGHQEPDWDHKLISHKLPKNHNFVYYQAELVFNGWPTSKGCNSQLSVSKAIQSLWKIPS